MHTEFTKIIQNEILHAQCTTHKAVILLYKLTGITLYGQKIKIRLLMVNSLWVTLCVSYLISNWDCTELKQKMELNRSTNVSFKQPKGKILKHLVLHNFQSSAALTSHYHLHCGTQVLLVFL